MKKPSFLFVAIFLALSSLSYGQVDFNRDFAPSENGIKSSEKPFRDEICLNGRWQFQPLSLPEEWKRNAGMPPELSAPKFDAWEKTPIKIPSPWNVNTWGGGRDAGTKAHNKYWPDSVYYPSYPESWDKVEMGWLRRTFKLPDHWNPEEKRFFLHFEAVAGDCVVLVNGQKAGEHFDKFLPFELDVTKLVKTDGENELLIGIRSHTLFDKQSEKYSKMRATYPPGSEMHRLVGVTEDVMLLAKPMVWVDDVFVKPLVSENQLELEVTLRNASALRDVEITAEVSPWINRAGTGTLDAPEPRSEVGKPVLRFEPEKTSLQHGAERITIRQKVDGRLNFWTPETPNLYVVDVKVKIAGKETDVNQTRFGWREFTIDGKDLLLNGKKIRLFGDLLHPFGPYIHSRRFVWSWYTMIKDMGGNAVRPHAQIHPRIFLEMADEMGIVVLAENSIFGSSIMLNFEEPVTWRRYADHTRGMVLRDRNHPSIVGWSIGNELFAIFHLNNVTPEDTKNYYDKIVELGRICNDFDPTRTWISCDGDEDLQGRISVWSKHFGLGNHSDRLPDIGKPLMVGESGGTYYATPKQLSVFNGDRAYESYEGRNEALGIDVYENIVRMARPRLAFFSASETAWFGIEHLPFGYTDRTRRPALDDGVFFTKPFEENKRGMQPERLPPYVSTFNPGWDERLPLYKPLEMFHAEKAAIAGENYEPKRVLRGNGFRQTHEVPDRAAFVGRTNSPLKKMLDSIGIPFAEKTSEDACFLIVDADSLDAEGLAKASLEIERNLHDGGTAIVFAQNNASNGKAGLSKLLKKEIELTERDATMLLPNRNHAWSDGFGLPDLYFAEDGDGRFIQKAGLGGKDVETFETVLEASDCDWSLFNRVAEHSKCAALLIYERMIKPDGKALVVRKQEKGTLAVCSLDYRIDTKSTRRFWRSLFEKMGVKLNAEGTMTVPAIHDDEKSLVHALVLGRLTDREAEQAIASAIKTPPRDKERMQGKSWQIFKSPSKDRILFNWIPQEGAGEDFVQLFSFWIRSPRALDDLLADGPDAPKFGMLTYVADRCDIYLNGEKMSEERTEPVDYRTLYHWNDWPLKKDWNHVLICVRSKHLDTDGPGTLAVRIRSNNPAFLNELDSAVESPKEVETEK